MSEQSKPTLAEDPEESIDPKLLFALPTKYATFFSEQGKPTTLLEGIRKTSSFQGSEYNMCSRKSSMNSTLSQTPSLLIKVMDSLKLDSGQTTPTYAGKSPDLISIREVKKA